MQMSPLQVAEPSSSTATRKSGKTPTGSHTSSSGDCLTLAPPDSVAQGPDSGAPAFPTASHTDSDEERSGSVHGRAIRVTTRTLVLTVFCTSIVMICALAFFPSYWLNFGDAFVAVRVAQRETVSGLALAIDAFLARAAAAAISSMSLIYIGAPERLPRNHSDVLAQMANVLSSPTPSSLVDVLHLVVAIPGREWRAAVYSSTTVDPSRAPIVAYQSSLSAPCQWRLWDQHCRSFSALPEPATNTVEASLCSQTLGKLLSDPEGTFQRLVVPWNTSSAKSSCGDATPTSHVVPCHVSREEPLLSEQTVSRCHRSCVTARWNYLHRNPLAFFDIVVPFRVVDAAGHEGLAYWEATLHNRRVVEAAVQHYNEAVQHYSHFVVMNTRNNLVSMTSWNQSSASSLPWFPAEEINMPLMRAVVEEYRRRRPPLSCQYAATTPFTVLYPALSVHAEPTHTYRAFDYSFPFEGEHCQVFVHTVGGTDSAALVVLVATLESDLFAPVSVAKRVLLRIVAVTVTLTMVALSAAVSQVLVRLQHLFASLEDTLLLQVDDAYTDDATSLSPQVPARTHSGDPTATMSHPATLGDLHHLSDALDRLRRRVQGVKSILPDSLIIEAQPGPGAGASVHDPLSSSLSTTILGSSLSQGGESADVSRQRHRATLNLMVFNDKVNVFQQRYCTGLWACRYYTNDTNDFSFEEFFEAGYNASVEFDGCLEFLRPDYLVISFGAHIHMPMHSAQACLCALSFWNHLSERNRSQLIFLLDSREFCVGTCGKQDGRKRRVVFDVTYYMHMLRFLQSKGVHNITATQRAVAHIPEHLSVPYIFLKANTRDPQVLFELRGPVAVDPSTAQEDVQQRRQMERDARAFRKAFHEMRNGQYSEAMNIYADMCPRDALAVYLHKYCADQVANGNTAPLVSRAPDVHFHWMVRGLVSPFTRPIIMQYLASAVAAAAKGTTESPPPAPRALSAMSSANSCHAVLSSTHAPSTALISPQASNVDGDVRGVAPPGLTAARRTTEAQRTCAPSQVNAEHVDLDVPNMPWLTEDESPYAPSGDKELHGVHSHPLSGGRRVSVGQTSELSMGTGTAQESFATPADQALATLYENAPAELVDSNDVKWILSKTLLGHTSVGVWYAVVSEKGVQARLERLPRERSILHKDELAARLNSLVQLQHANVLQYMGYIMTTSCVALITEDARGGSLHDMLSAFGPLDYLTVRRYTLDILLGLGYLHAVDTVHGDLNLHTVVIGGEGVCKLADVGWSTMFDRLGGDSATHLSPPRWLKETAIHTAPEVAAGQPRTKSSDIYALGVLVLELVLGFVPMSWRPGVNHATSAETSAALDDVNNLASSIGSGDLVVAIPTDLASSVALFVRACCHPDPQKRPTAQELFSYPLVL